MMEPENFHRAGLAALQAGGRLDEAIGALRIALVLSPGHADATLDLAIALRGKRHFDASAALCRRALALRLGWSEALYHLGRAYMAEGGAKAAEKVLRYALATDPSLIAAWHWLAQAKLRSPEPASARRAFNAMATLDPDTADHWAILAAFEAEHGQAQAALRATRKWLALAPDNSQAWIALARSFESHDGMAAAMPFGKRALCLAPTLPDMRYQIHLLYHLGRYRDLADPCVALLKQPSATADDQALAFWVLGECGLRGEIDVRSLPDERFAALAEKLTTPSATPGRRQATRHSLANADGDAASPFLRAMLSRQLGTAGWNPHELAQAGILSEAICARFFADQALPASARAALLPVLGYCITSPRSWNQWIFEHIALPGIKDAAHRGDFELVRLLVTFTQWTVRVQPHTFEQARLCYERFAPLFWELGHRLRDEFGAIPAKSGRGIAFFMDTLESDPPFHIERAIHSLLRNAGDWRKRLGPIHVVSFADVSDRFYREYEAIGVTVVTPNRCPASASGKAAEPHTERADRVLRLALWVREQGFAAVVFLNSVEGLTELFAGMRMAPVQMFMSPDFFHIASPDMDALLAFGALGKWTSIIDGRLWRCLPFPFAIRASQNPLEKAELAHRALGIRQALLGRFNIILGSLGRPEKLSAEFLDAVSNILHANPDACFLWFGRQEPPNVRQAMEERGISERCLFQGWVDTWLYAQVLDIHLDSFPFPTGLTMVEVMLAGRAQVWMKSDAASQLSIGGSIERMMLGQAGTPEEQAACRRIFAEKGSEGKEKPLFLFSKTIDQYCAITQRLIDDPAYREHLGRSGRAFVEHFIFDETRPADVLFSHINDVIQEKSLPT